MTLSLRERAASHKSKKESKLNELLSNLENKTACTLSNESDMFYMITPSCYKKGYYQLTTFIRNEPYSHTQEPTIKELVTKNIGELINYTIKEAI